MKIQKDPRKRVRDGLYRNTISGCYSAHFKCKGRVIKKSLKTKELVVAIRKLRDLRDEAELLDPGAEGRTLREQTDLVLELRQNECRCEEESQRDRLVTAHRPGLEGVHSGKGGGDNSLVPEVNPSAIDRSQESPATEARLRRLPESVSRIPSNRRRYSTQDSAHAFSLV